MIINHNMNAMNAHRMLMGNTSEAGKSMEKLSSGLRINRAGDDAAGLAISEKMRGQIRGLDQATRNSQDGISLIQTAEGALNETHSILQRMRELAVQAGNDTNNNTDRGQIQKEINQLTSEINRIGNTTEFNTMKLLNGDKSANKVVGTRAAVLSGLTGVSTAVGITNGASALNLASKVTFASSPGDGFDFTNISATAAVNTLTISKNASGNLEVKLKANNDAGGIAFSSVDNQAITWDANNQYTFNSHGISFKINKADFDAASTNTKVIDLYKADGGTKDLTTTPIDTANSWGTTNTSGFSKITGGVTVDGSKLPAGLASAAASVDVTILGAAGSNNIGTLTVTIKDAAGNTLATDMVSSITAASQDYNNMGISFTASAISSAASGTVSISLGKGTANVTQDNSLTFQVGANEHQAMSVSVNDMRAAALGISTTTAGGDFGSDLSVNNGTDNAGVEYSLDVSTAPKASHAVTILQSAIDKVSDERSKLGAYQNRLEHTINNLGTSSENLQSAESRIRDVDMANEMMNYSKKNILAQASQAMLAQAKSQPEQVLQLLR